MGVIAGRLHQSDNPEERSLAEILSSLTEIKTELSNVHRYSVAQYDDTLRVIDNFVNMVLNALSRVEGMFEKQHDAFENVEAALKQSNTSPYVPEETSSLIARYLLAKLPSDRSVSGEVANEIAMMLMRDNKADAVLKLSKETGLGEERAHEILTRINIQRTKDDLLRSVRLS